MCRPQTLAKQLQRQGGPLLRQAGRAAAAMVAVLALVLLPLLQAPAPALAASPEAYRCDGDPLLALADNGAVDATGIPNTAAGTVPGAFVVLQWRGVTLQLPRTNNAGAPSYTDGKWWWSLENPAAPRFQLRQGGVISYACERAA
jgi:hypothetical protein